MPTYDGPGRAGDAVEADRDIAEQRRSRSDTAPARPAQRPSVIELFEGHYRRERAIVPVLRVCSAPRVSGHGADLPADPVDDLYADDQWPRTY